PGRDGRGRGLAFARYKNQKAWCAVAVELTVDGGAAVRLARAAIAADAGQIGDPDGIVNQLEGGFVQAASWTLREAVTFDRTRVTSTDWQSYPILGFGDVPPIETVLLDRPGEPWLGAGEASQGPTAAAIANAIFDATGLRVRDLPLTAERLREAAWA
ncbi:MAG TPA: molybdopterin cofactor-binding domain-containing protein, partial [Kofleriaceae bacterium]